MPRFPGLTEGLIRSNAAAEAFARGQSYAQNGAVHGLVQRGMLLEARVHGSQYEPYRVEIEFDQGGIAYTHCTCPYSYGGWCKHVVAVLLTCLNPTLHIEERPLLEEQLASLARDELQAILLTLAEERAENLEAIERQIILRQPQKTAAQPQTQPTIKRTPIDPQPIRRQVHSILNPRYDNYGYAGNAINELGTILTHIEGFIIGGDSENALRLLEAFTAEYCASFYQIDDSDGELGGFVDDIGTAWAEALLTADLSRAERKEWLAKLREWRAAADDYGAGDGFAIAEQAASEGWDDPDIQMLLAGQIAEPIASAETYADEGEEEDQEYEDEDDQEEEDEDWSQRPVGSRSPSFISDLNSIRLTVLERQGRFDEYLNFARATDQTLAYARMLVRQGQILEATDVGLTELTSAPDALLLAVTLRENSAINAAIHVAEHGLDLGNDHSKLAAWLLDVAEGHGQLALALRAAEVAVMEGPSLALYQRTQNLAGDAWPALRERLLTSLRVAGNQYMRIDGAIEILLAEEQWDDAIGLVRTDYGGTRTLLVMNAVRHVRPDWVIATARQHADAIIASGKAQRYDTAITWLAQARDTYRRTGRTDEWQHYLSEIRQQHGRKYKLMGLMEGL